MLAKSINRPETLNTIYRANIKKSLLFLTVETSKHQSDSSFISIH